MGRHRQHDRHLPERVYVRRGAYYYATPAGPWEPLGRDLATALAKYSSFVTPAGAPRTFADVLDRYLLEVIPGKAPRTQADQRRQMPALRAAFGHLMPDQVTARLVMRFRNARAQQISKPQVNQELALLSHACSTAIEWDAMESNPCRDVRKFSLPPRDHYVTDVDYRRVHAVAEDRLRVFMELALLTGQREGDLRALTWEQVTADGIEFTQGKTGKRLIVTWSKALRATITRARRIKPVGPTVVSTRHGLPYNQNAFSSLWRRAIDRASKAKQEPLQRPFRFHDLRAKSASDDSLTAASERLGHADARITQRVYRRAPARVAPLDIGRGRGILNAAPRGTSRKAARK